MADLLTTEEIDECAAYVRGNGKPPSKETINHLMLRLGDFMEENAMLIGKVADLLRGRFDG